MIGLSIEDQIQQLHSEVLELNEKRKGWYDYIDEIRNDTESEVATLHIKIEKSLERIDEITIQLQKLFNLQLVQD
jgi:DNA polymerase III delta prime subunit